MLKPIHNADRSKILAATLATLILCLLPDLARSQSLPGWTNHQSIVLNTTATGANVAGDVKAFPVPVQLTAANFDFTQAQANGADLRFTTAAGAALPYEIESWDAAAKKAAVWVKADVKGNDKTQAILMHWGNPAAKSESNSKAVFALEDGWVGVWHMGEPGNTAAGGYKDATPNEAHATGFGFQPANTADCRMGKCPEFKFSDKRHITLDGPKKALFDITNKLTFSIWTRATDYKIEYVTMFAKGDDSWRVQMYGIYSWGDNNGKYITEMCVESGGDACLEHRDAGMELKPNAWYHLTVVQDYPNVRYYINTVSATKNVGGTWTSNPQWPVGIGYQSQTNDRFWEGNLDEARVMRVAKDDNWVKLDYESQREGSKLLEFGAAATGLARDRPSEASRLPPMQSGRILRYDLHGRWADANPRPGIYLEKRIAGDGTGMTVKRAFIP